MSRLTYMQALLCTASAAYKLQRQALKEALAALYIARSRFPDSEFWCGTSPAGRAINHCEQSLRPAEQTLEIGNPS